MKRSIPIFAAVLFLGALDVSAQERLLAGPTVGYEFSVPLLLRRSEGAINYDATFPGTGRSYSHTAHVGAHFVAPAAPGGLGYSARLSLFATSGYFRSDPFIPGLSLTDTMMRVDVSPERFRRIEVDMTAATIVADAQARLSIGESILAGAGVWGSYRLSGQFLRTERPEFIPPDIDPEDAMVVTGGERIAAYEIGYGGLLSLGALIRASSAITLMPELTSRVDAVALREGMGFQAFTIGAGVSVLFNADQTQPVVEAAPRDLTPTSQDRIGAQSERDGTLDSLATADPALSATPTPSTSMRLEARVDLFADGVEERTKPAVVESEEVINRVVIALPRVVSYDQNAFDFAGGFARIQREDVEGFTTRSLAGLDIAGHWRQYLNILGMRLRDAAGTTLTVTGRSTAAEPQSLARVRAEVIRDYLVEVWGISSSRLSIRAEKGTFAQVRFDGPEALFSQPLLSQWRTRRYRMPQLGLERYVVADAGVRHWSIALTQGDRSLARFDSDSSSSDPALELRFIAGGDSAAPIAPIVATLAVEDSLGRTTIAKDELPIQRGAARTRSTADEERLELVAFDEALDSVDAAAERRRAAHRAARMLRDGARVRVGLVGRISEESRRVRAVDVARLSEELLAAANERGVRIGRFVAERDGGGEATPGGVLIVIEQDRASDESIEP